MARRNVALNGPDEIDRAVGARIRRYRLLAGMSQTALADRIGCSFQQLQKYERADNRVSASRLVRIADAFGVPVADLFADCGDAGAGEAAAAVRPGAARLLREYNAIACPHRRSALLHMAAALAGEPDEVPEAEAAAPPEAAE